MPWGQPSSAASIWPVWLQSSSIACLPMMTSCGCSLLDDRLQRLGDGQWLQLGVGLHQDGAVGPHGQRRAQGFLAGLDAQATTIISVAVPASFRRTASSTAISSKGFIDILTLAVSTPDAVRLDADLHVVVDHPLHGDEDLHD